MNMKSSVSVVIPVFNGMTFLPETLPAVLSIGVDEVIVVDDASTDGSADFIAKSFPQIKLLRHSNNLRFPQTVNDGFEKATGEIVVLLNQDAIPDKDILKTTLIHFTKPQFFAVTFNAQNQSWATADIKDGLVEYTNGTMDNQTHRSFWASGGACAIKKSVWQQLGGFDPIFTPGYLEDLDLGWRAWRRGYAIVWEPNAKVTHPKPESTFNKSFTQKKLQRIKDRNYLLAHWKNLDQVQFAQHLYSLVSRVLSHPGFIIPVILTIPMLYSVYKFRVSEACFIKKANSDIFPIV